MQRARVRVARIIPIQAELLEMAKSIFRYYVSEISDRACSRLISKIRPIIKIFSNFGDLDVGRTAATILAAES